jgi:hypothetical protein
VPFSKVGINNLYYARPPYFPNKNKMGFTKAALVGASGLLGQAILRHLQNCTTSNFEITILRRLDAGDKAVGQFDSNVHVKSIDYYNHDMLVDALRGTEVIVSALNVAAAIQIDPLLLKAGREAGVKRIFPSEYTLDILHEAAVRFIGESDARVRHARQFSSLLATDSISATTMVSGMFMDFALRGHHGNYNPEKYEATLFDGGNVPATGCSSDFIAACVVSALQMAEDQTKNKRIHIAEVKYTGRQILEVLELETGSKFTVTQVPSSHLQENLALAKEQGLVREKFILPVMILNFAAVDENGEPYGAGLLEDGLRWDGGGFLHQKRKTLVELAHEALRA